MPDLLPDDMTTPVGVPEASCSALRLTQKTSGPFNTGETDVTDLFTSEEITVPTANEIAMTTVDPSAIDLLSALEDNGTGVCELDDGLMDIVGLKEAFSLDGDSDFLEMFTDLSDYLEGNQDLDMEMKEDVPSTSSVCPAISETRPTNKRTASEAFPFTGDPPSANPDHNDYTAKSDKRKRLCTADSDTIMDSQDACSDSQPKPRSREEKYRERRIKNNIASRRSRESRKQKFTSMEEKAMELEKSNAELRAKIEELEALTKQMKQTLVQRLTNS